jgi:hypothetical protein
MSSSGLLSNAPGPTSTTPAQRLIVAWQEPVSREIHPVGLLEITGGSHRFRYIANADSVSGFRPLLGFPDLDRAYESEWLFPLFAERVMDPRRPDHARYLEALQLDSDASPFEVLAASNGRRIGDTIQLFPEPEISGDGRTSCRFLVHGIRYVLREEPAAEQRLDRLQVGDRLQLIDEPANPYNARAILTADGDGGHLGWVPNMLLEYVHTVRATGEIRVEVARRNQSDAPAHLRLLAQLTGRVPVGYRAFAGPKWEPLVR